jgi:hypothetical protein
VLRRRHRSDAAGEAELTNCEPAFEVSIWRDSPKEHHEIGAQAVRRRRGAEPALELIASDRVVSPWLLENLHVELDDILVVRVAARALAELVHGASEGVEDMRGRHFDRVLDAGGIAEVYAAFLHAVRISYSLFIRLVTSAACRHSAGFIQRSLAYFLPVVDEVIAMRVSPDYFHYVRHKLERIAHDR